MSNSVDIRYRADTSQSVLATDKLLARVAKLEGQLATATSKSTKQNNLYGRSWDAVSARVAHFSRAVKSATNLRDFLSATESLQKARKEFELINARVDEFTAKVTEVAATPVFDMRSLAGMRQMRDTLKETATIQFGGEFEDTAVKIRRLNAEIAKMEALFNGVQSKPIVPAVNLNSLEAVKQKLEYIREEMNKTGSGREWDRLNKQAIELEGRLAAVGARAKETRAGLSEAATAPKGSWMRLGYELEQAKLELMKLTLGTKEFIAQQQKVAALQKAWDNVNTAVNKTNKSQQEGGGILDSVLGQAKTLAATYIGIHQTVQLVTEEWEKQRAFQLDANRKELGIEGEMVRQAANIGADNLPAVKQWARENQVDLLATQQELVGLVGAAISSGEPDVNKAQKAAAAALRINVGDAQMANEMLQGGLTIGRINNSDDYEAAFGQLRSSSKVSQAVNEAEFIGNITGKMAALTRGRKNMDGMTSERALEFITSASRIQVDRTGEASSTNMAAIFQRMDEFMPERKKKLKDKTESRVDQATIDAFVAARTFDEKLTMLQSNKDLGNQFIDKQRTGGPKELAFALIQNNKATKDIMKEAADAVLPFNQARAVFGQEQNAVRAAVPNRIAARQREAGVEQARTGDRTQLMASARATWDSVWNASADGTAPANLAGIDKMERLSSFMDRSSWEAQRKAGTLKDGGNEVTDMIKSLKDIRDRNERVGNTEAVGSLDAQLKALKTIADKLDELNAQVAAGKNNPAPAARPVAPAAQAPPVPRMPAMNLNARGGDVFGWFKK